MRLPEAQRPVPPAYSAARIPADRTERIVVKELAALRQSLAIAVVCVLAGCGAGGDEGGGGHPDYAKALAGAPPPLAALHRQSNDLIDGGVDAYDARIRGLRGYPVVVNVWASWCGPCRFEFPSFQSLSARYGKQVAFLGINSQDSDAAARTFLGERPVPYPSYTDPDKEVADSIGANLGLPDTAFYSRGGKLVYLKQGPYGGDEQLRADIERYAIGGAEAEQGG
jgi:cytochrome c biogenesis protein CcmG, thiol:disulfide interchange protein DsbE